MNLIQLALRDLILDTIKNIQKHNPGEIINWVARNLIAKYSLANDYYHTTQFTLDKINALGLEISKRGNKKKANGYTYEHPIPSKVVFEQMLTTNTGNEFDKILRYSDKIVILSSEEDSLLTKAKLGRAMPNGWRFFDAVFSRYDSVGISVLGTKVKMTGAIKR